MQQCRAAISAESRIDSTTYFFEPTVQCQWILGQMDMENNTTELGILALGLWS